MSDNIKKLTILHSNDLHGDFLPKTVDGKETGGLARLSGYVRKIRAEKPNVIYANAGDMFRGSVIDSEYKGLSTIDLMNTLNPDVATIGNHEVDYGFAHLLFLEKCAKFPIVNANLFITMNNSRVFTPYINIERDGMKILFIGILTEEVLASTRNEKIIGTFIDLESAAKEVGIICDNYRTIRTDMTVLLTHIGLENDIKLAQMLDPDWGVNMIIGGHSHTFMEKPEWVNGIPIVQAGTGTGQIGQIDIQYDQDNKTIEEFKWKCVPINEDTAPVDDIMADLIDSYRTQTDSKYKRVVTRW
ncbi:MAG: metallophosphatase, partial [Firmicutes bacterium]|nr:metallophosphatase [Bacillota bacterium]